MNTRQAHDTHSHTTSPLRAPSRKVLSSEFFLALKFFAVKNS